MERANQRRGEGAGSSAEGAAQGQTFFGTRNGESAGGSMPFQKDKFAVF